MSTLSTGHLDQAEALSANRYRVLMKLGEGGMAEVFLAMQQGITDFRRLVVVKRLRMMFADSEHYQKMFLEEARLSTRLNHPNVVHTYEVGQDGTNHFIAMEYLAGHSLHQALRRFGKSKYEFACVVRVLIEVLKGLEYAHQQRELDGTPLNLVHRDISPSNIFITYDGRIKVLDFGIAKATGSSIETNVGTIKGKLTYMAPEQARRENVTMQADLYAVGVMLWEVAAGRRRWEQDLDDVAIFGLLLENRRPEAPNAESRGLPKQMDAICLRALDPNPGARFKDAADFRRTLEGLLLAFPDQPTAEDVGKEISERFSDEREKVKAKITGKVQASDPPEEDPSVRSLIWRKPDRSMRPSAPTVALLPNSQPARRSALKTALLVGAFAAALAGTALATVQLTPQEKQAPPVVVETTVQAAQEVVVTVVANPPTATLFWNERLLVDNPTAERHEKSAKRVTVRAEAEGFEPEERRISLEESSDLIFDLKPTAGAKATEDRASKRSVRIPTRPRPRTVTAAPAKSTPTSTGATPKVKLDTSDPWAD